MNETDLQMHVVNYIRMQYPKARFCASLGGIRTSISQAKKAKRTGYWAGFPDLQITEPNHNYYGLFIEIKTETGRATKNQRIVLFSIVIFTLRFKKQSCFFKFFLIKF